MSRLRANHDPFVVDGGCTCPGARSLFQARIEGHTADCTETRRRGVDERRRLQEALQAAAPAREPLRAIAAAMRSGDAG